MSEAQHSLKASSAGVVVGSIADLDESGKAAGARNYFLGLLPDAVLEMRRILKTSVNEKLRKETARDIIELAGAGGGPKTAPVVINADQVNLLLKVGREVLGE